MEKFVTQGLVRSLGVSNFNSTQLRRLYSKVDIKPVCNQVCHTPTHIGLGLFISGRFMLVDGVSCWLCRSIALPSNCPVNVISETTIIIPSQTYVLCHNFNFPDAMETNFWNNLNSGDMANRYSEWYRDHQFGYDSALQYDEYFIAMFCIAP